MRTRRAACSSSATSRRSRTRKHSGRFLAPLRRIDWVVYCKDPFGGPEQVLRYLSRYTHRVAISNRRLIAADDGGVSFRWKDYRIEGPERWKTMTLSPAEFIRRFLIHVLPKGFHRIRHYGLFANGNRAENIAKARELLAVAPPVPKPEPVKASADEPRVLPTMSLLRRTHARHRGVRTRLRTKASANTDACRNQDRYVMKERNRLPCRSVDRCRWSCAGIDPSCLNGLGRHAKCPFNPMATRLRWRADRVSGQPAIQTCVRRTRMPELNAGARPQSP